MTTTSPTAETSEPASRRPPLLARMWRLQAMPALAATILLLIVAGIIAPHTFTPASMVAIVIPAAVLAIAGIGQTLVIQQRGIDLSMPGVITLAAILSGVTVRDGVPFVASLLIVAAVAVAAGLVNAFIVTKLHITPLLATLASNYIFIGLVWTISGGAAQVVPGELTGVAAGQFLGFPLIGWIAVVLIALTALVMTASVFGRRFTGVGANPAAARVMGVVPGRHIALAYVASSCSAALAGLLVAGYAGQATYDIGTPYQLPIIAAVVVGGAALAGGRGSVVATGLGALLLTVIVQVILTLGAPQSAQLLAQALVFAAAATLRLVPWGRLVREPSARDATPLAPPSLATSVGAVDPKKENES